MKLTNKIRDAIIDNAVAKAGYPVKFAKIKERRVAWVEKFRIECLGGTVKTATIEAAVTTMMEQIKALPDVWRTNPRLNYSGFAMVGPNWERHYWDGEIDTARDDSKSEKRLTVSEYTRPGKALEKSLATIDRDFEKLQTKERELRSQVAAAVYGFTTDAKLVEFWPEVIELMPKTEQIRQAGLPAIRVEDLNKAVGI